jgi:hypothetical protein
MAFVSTLGKTSTARRAAVGFARDPHARLRGMGDLGKQTAAVRSIARNNATIRFRLRGLGETSCTIDPTTGGRVCTSGPATAATPSSTCTSITPRYLPDPTQQQWNWDNKMPANWIFTGRDNVNSIYDMYMRQDGQAFAAVGPGGGFMYNDPRRATVPAYGPCVAPAPAPVPVPVPVPTNQVIDQSTGQPTTIQPVAPQPYIPSPMVATAAPAYAPSGGSFLDGIPTWAKWGGGLVGVVLVLGIAKKALK